jgi:serine/threonine protein phosphatase PrpC
MFKLASKVKGSSINHQECQDACLIINLPNVDILIISDGHSSAKFAAIGSELVVSRVKEVLTNLYHKYPVLKTFGKILNSKRKAIIAEIVKNWTLSVLDDYYVRNNNYDAHDLLLYYQEINKVTVKNTNSNDSILAQIANITRLYGATLKCSVISKEFVFCFGIGDGDILLVNHSDCYSILPESVFHSNKTASICNKIADVINVHTHFKYINLKSNGFLSDSKLFKTNSYLICCSDGLEGGFKTRDEYYYFLNTLAKVLNSRFSHLIKDNMEAYLANLSELGDTCDDISVCIYQF